MVQIEPANPRLAGVLEAALVGGAGDAIFVIAVGEQGRAGGGGGLDDRPALVGVKLAPVGCAAALVPDQRLVHAGAVDVAHLNTGSHLVKLSLSLIRPEFDNR